MDLKCYNFSGIKIGIQSEQKLPESDKLAEFRTECSEPDYTVKLKFLESLPDDAALLYGSGQKWHSRKTTLDDAGYEKPFAYVSDEKGKSTMLAVERLRDMFDAGTVLRHLPLHHAFLEFDAVVLHSSYILVDGKAILFSAPSGTGKSTQAQLWEKYRGAEIINGDRTLIRKTENGFTAGGIYYSGTSGICRNVTAPLRAIVLLGQSGQSTVEKCGGAEAFRRLFRQCAYTSDFENDPAVVTDILVNAVNNVDIVKLDCLPDESAVNALENYLSGDND